MANPDFKYESTKALSEMLKNYIRSEKWSAIITGHDDYLSNYSLEYLGLQGMLSKENSSLMEDLQREGAIEQATKQAKAQK